MNSKPWWTAAHRAAAITLGADGIGGTASAATIAAGTRTARSVPDALLL
jgi:hypothetical protein